MTSETLHALRAKFSDEHMGICPNAILVAEPDVLNFVISDYCRDHNIDCYPCSILLPGHPKFILS